MTDQTPKMVPESDLLAVKARLDKETTEWSEKLASALQSADSHHSKLLAEQAAKEKLAAELEELKSEAEKLRGLSPLKEQLEKELAEVHKQLLGASLKRIAQVYKVPEDKLLGKTLAELNLMEETLKLVGRDTGRFDTGATATGVGAAPLTAREKLQAGFEQISKK